VRTPFLKKAQDTAGFAMIAAIGALVLVAIFTPLLLRYVQNEAIWSTKQRRTTTAFHLAEAGVDRGLWKLTESKDIWTDAKNGIVIAGYDDDVVYTDVAGGEYKIKFSSGPQPGYVTVRAKGRDTSNLEMRVVEAAFTKDTINAGLQVEGGMDYRPNMHIHWGPVVNFTSINQAPSDYYPRKYSKGQIVGRDTVDDSDNTDDLEYWVFHDDLGEAPDIDLDYYKTAAKNSQVPVTTTSPDGKIERNAGGSTLAVASPTGSGYFMASQNGNTGLRFDKTGGGANRYQFINSTSVIYIDKDVGGSIETVMRNGSYLAVEALIIAGAGHNLDCNADSYDNFMATVPESAPREYQHPSAAAQWLPFAATYANPGRCCYDIDDLAAHGFIYVGGNMTNAGGGTKIVGVVDVIGTITMNTVTVYYDTAVADAIKLVGRTPRRVGWRETKADW
jgi:hypothetical protein